MQPSPMNERARREEEAALCVCSLLSSVALSLSACPRSSLPLLLGGNSIGHWSEYIPSSKHRIIRLYNECCIF